MRSLINIIGILLLGQGIVVAAVAAPGWRTDSWKQVREQQSGTITVLWDEIEPFIYLDKSGALVGIEYELMEGFRGFVEQEYGVQLKINWVKAKEFKDIYPQIRSSDASGLFALSYYSITAERKKEVKFSPPYMPDLNVLVSNNSMPAFESGPQLIAGLKKMTGYTLGGTTMEQDLLTLRERYFTAMPVKYNPVNDYEVLKDIAADPGGIGYVPVSIYVVALQRGIKVKRQRLFDVRREGFAAIYPKNSDWDEPVNRYFNSTGAKMQVSALIRKYLGEEVADIILDISAKDSLGLGKSDIELLTKEREIVTQRLIDTALVVERQRIQQGLLLIAAVVILMLAALFYSRYHTRKKLVQQLAQRNQLIVKQNEQIEQMNQLLKLKVLQGRMNPHFLFNSLNSIQYFITADNKKASIQYISKFSTFLRKIIHYGDELSISSKDEASLLEEYLWLEQTRFPGRFDYKITLPEHARQAAILPLIVHSLVEDALYKGVLNIKDNRLGKINIDFNLQDDGLWVAVTDNGISRESADQLEKRKGISSGEESVLSRRIRLFNRQGSRKINLQYTAGSGNNEEGFNRTSLYIPQPLFDGSFS
ncbi:histidine kinase [uncultured Chitinophaga sp.]|jgi:Putative regulator of cell autolysis|uniref:histidine kinase n=1 Tax=uncultured Chitinophaga sp. TaxID=339340 RepID=UPI0026379197|nr:histidine kinase [uncultured Chitinophaga sp.]